MGCSVKNRAQELGIALEEGRARKGNHNVEVTRALLPSDPDLCKPCPSNFQCYLRGVQVSFKKAAQMYAPCVRHQAHIKFFYHSSCCITYDIALGRITDHGYWGYSPTTSRAIGAYLGALWEHDFLPSGHVVDFLKICFKKEGIPPRLHKTHPGGRYIDKTIIDEKKDRWYQLC